MRNPIDNATRRRLIQEWRASGESARTFALRQGVPLSTFYEWSRRFSVSEEPAFTELVVVENEPQALGGGARVQLEVGGVMIDVGRETDLELLAQVLRVLRAC